MQSIQNPRLYIRRKASAEGRAPRTMQEAFPEHQGGSFWAAEPGDPPAWGQAAVAILIAVGFISICFL